ncbi:hypothetical protein D3C73_705210 [compost metagenome]
MHRKLVDALGQPCKVRLHILRETRVLCLGADRTHFILQGPHLVRYAFGNITLEIMPQAGKRLGKFTNVGAALVGLGHARGNRRLANVFAAGAGALFGASGCCRHCCTVFKTAAALACLFEHALPLADFRQRVARTLRVARIDGARLRTRIRPGRHTRLSIVVNGSLRCGYLCLDRCLRWRASTRHQALNACFQSLDCAAQRIQRRAVSVAVTGMCRS